MLLYGITGKTKIQAFQLNSAFFKTACILRKVVNALPKKKKKKPFLFGFWQNAQISEQRIVTCIGTIALWEVSGTLLPSCFPTNVSGEQ